MECVVCRETSPDQKIKRCSRCRKAIYCSAKCQRVDWPQHRAQCLSSTGATEGELPKQSDHDVVATHRSVIYYTQHSKIVEKFSLDTFNPPANINLTVKYTNVKTHIDVSRLWPGHVIMKLISEATLIPLDDMKVIIRGRLCCADDIKDMLSSKSTAMVLGTPCEPSDDIDERDIECLMSQMSITRNNAIKVLKKTGSLLDAILDIGNS